MQQAASRPVNVLFLCTGNACRSQMAEGWARYMGQPLLQAYSAGVVPHGLNPLAVQVMSEVGVDISGYQSKHLNTLQAIPFEWVVTVCDHAAKVCPVYTGTTKMLHRSFPDPPQLAQGLTGDAALVPYRQVRDAIRQFIAEMLPQWTNSE
jgi:arsenate reductase